MLEYFPLRLYSYEFPWRKPDVRIFQAAADKIGIAPQNIAYIGDRIDNDVNGAAKAGMLPILIKAYTNENKTIPAGIHCINDNTELPTLIQKICDLPNKSNDTKTTETVCKQG
jgi:putative hydrolase of the HAD superfamily